MADAASRVEPRVDYSSLTVHKVYCKGLFVDKIKKSIRPCGKTYKFIQTQKEFKTMIITLKDGSKKEYSEAKSVIDIAYDISEGLARAACAGEVNGEVVDLRTVLDSDSELNILTAKDEKGHLCRWTHSPCDAQREPLVYLHRQYRTYIRKQRLQSDLLLIQDFIMISITYRSHVRIWTQLRKK